MPIHQWKRVPPGIFHDFHQEWSVALKHTLNGILPAPYYALIEQAKSGRFPDVLTFQTNEQVYAEKANRVVVLNDADQVVAVLEIVSSGNKSNRDRFDQFLEKALQFIRTGVHFFFVDLFPPTIRDPQGLHAAIWSEMTEYDFQLPDGKPLMVASYSCGVTRQAFVEAMAVGDVLPAMPLFLQAGRYVRVPLDATYQTAFDALPNRWRDVLTSATENR